MSAQLAIDGGRPVRSAPFPPWPHFAEDEIRAASAVLRSGRVNYWTGDEGKAFEKEFAGYVGMPYGVSVANGTLALELALHALDIPGGSHVVVPSRTFIATASCAVAHGLIPVVADVDPDSQNITAETLSRAMTPRTRAVIVVHHAGWPCDMEPILAFAAKHGLKVIEDCAQAPGAEYKGKQVGRFGDAAAFSFCQDKIITTAGEGGMLLLRDEAQWEKAWAYRDHGKDFRTVSAPRTSPGFRWVHHSFGTNWRMTEIQSAVGRAQLGKLRGWLEIRRCHAAHLDEALARIPGVRVTNAPAGVAHAYYKYYFFVEPGRLRSGWDRDRVMAALEAEGIPCQSGTCSEIYLERAFRDREWGPRERFETARRLGETSLMLLVHPTLSDGDIQDTVRAVRKIFEIASGKEGT